MIQIQEEVLMRMNKYPKSKYELIIGGKVMYSFVTTSRPPDECIELLKLKLDMYTSVNRRCYYIIRKANGVKCTIYKGSIEPIR